MAQAAPLSGAERLRPSCRGEATQSPLQKEDCDHQSHLMSGVLLDGVPYWVGGWRLEKGEMAFVSLEGRNVA